MSTAETVVGYIALFFWSFQLLPQAIKNYRNHSSGGLSAGMVALWALWTPVFSAYGLYSKLSVPLLVQPNLFGFFATICCVQCLYYTPNEKRRKLTAVQATGLLAVSLALLGALEAGLYYATLKASESSRASVTWIVTLMGILPTVLIVAGFFPAFSNIFRTSVVDGLSQPFLLMDTLGGVLSIIALLLGDDVDMLNIGSYAAVAGLDLAILVLIHVYRCTGRAKPVPAAARFGTASEMERSPSPPLPA
ncbi:hypothetical protein HDU86_002298 [Geranomyces michiganensis]|nr:hypothetical protein HDU86_002298 [Geranomyces michiganensis]